MVGQIAAELLTRYVHKGEVAIFVGNESVDVHKEILKGFKAGLSNGDVRLYKVFDTKEDLELSRQQVRQLLIEKPDIKGFFISTAKSIAALEEVTALNMSGKISIIGTDLFPEIAEFIDNGTVQATVFKNPRQQMIDAIHKLYLNISGIGEDTDDITVIPQIIIKSNLSAYLKP
jgi:LacI family transcriptional regulator